MNKNRFIIFSGDRYYPPENGIRAGAPTLEEAIAKIRREADTKVKKMGLDMILFSWRVMNMAANGLISWILRPLKQFFEFDA